MGCPQSGSCDRVVGLNQVWGNCSIEIRPVLFFIGMQDWLSYVSDLCVCWGDNSKEVTVGSSPDLVKGDMRFFLTPWHVVIFFLVF